MAELVLLQLVNSENEMTTSSEDDSDASSDASIDVWCKLQKEIRSNVDVFDVSESRLSLVHYIFFFVILIIFNFF
jgi:hypothetical protein